MIRHIFRWYIMLKTRYYFLKKLYPDYFILMLKKGKNCVFQEEIYLSKSFLSKTLLYHLDTLHINYMVIDNLKIMKKVSFKDNHYMEYLVKGILIDMVKKQSK